MINSFHFWENLQNQQHLTPLCVDKLYIFFSVRENTIYNYYSSDITDSYYQVGNNSVLWVLNCQTITQQVRQKS